MFFLDRFISNKATWRLLGGICLVKGESETELLLRLIDLGNAYRRAGRLDESVQQYQLAFEYVKEWGLKIYLRG